MRRTQRDQSGQRIWLSLENGVEGGDRLMLVPGHVLRQPEVQQQARISGLGLHHLTVDGNGFLVAAGGHQLAGLCKFSSQILRLTRQQRRYKEKKGEQHRCPPWSTIHFSTLPLHTQAETD